MNQSRSTRLFLLTAMFLFVGGCTTYNKLEPPQAGLGQTGLPEDLSEAARLERKMTDQDIADLLDLEVQAKLPTSLAVAKLASSWPGHPPTLVTPDVEELDAWRQIVAAHEEITGIQPVGSLAMRSDRDYRGPSLRDLREAAARTRCELLLVYTQAESNVSNFNEAAALYWTFVGLWLSPGTTLEHATAMQAALIDCRTGAILGTVWADSHEKTICAAGFEGIARTNLTAKTQKQARTELQEGFASLLDTVIDKSQE